MGQETPHVLSFFESEGQQSDPEKRDPQAKGSEYRRGIRRRPTAGEPRPDFQCGQQEQQHRQHGLQVLPAQKRIQQGDPQEEAVQEIKSKGFTLEEPQDETFIENLSYYQSGLGIQEEVEEHPMIIPVAFYKIPKEQEHHYWKREFVYIEEVELVEE